MNMHLEETYDKRKSSDPHIRVREQISCQLTRQLGYRVR